MVCSHTDMAVWLRADRYHNGLLRDQDHFLGQQEEVGFPQTGGRNERKRERQRDPTHHALGSRKGTTSFCVCFKIFCYVIALVGYIS